jgi:hypothetical protein
MATKAASNTMKEVQGFVTNARKRIEGLEKGLLKRGRAQQKELETLIKGVRDAKQIKAIEKQATGLSDEIRRRMEGLQGKVLLALGVASRSEIAQIHRDLTKLSKTVEALVTKRGGPAA